MEKNKNTKEKNDNLPSSHSGGELPGNHNGLSGGRGSQTLETSFAAFTRVVLPTKHIVLLFPDGNFQGTSLFPNRNISCWEFKVIVKMRSRRQTETLKECGLELKKILSPD